MQMTHTSEIPGVEALNQTIHSKIGMDRSAWLHLQRFKNLLDTSEHIVLPSTIELFSLHFQLHKPVFQTVEISNNAPIVFAFQCSGTGHAHLAISGKKKETITSSQGNSFISFFAPTACYNMEIPVQQDYQNLHILISPNKLNHLLNDQFDEVPKLLRPIPNLFGMKSALLSKLTNRYVGSRPADPQNSFNLDPYNKLDGRIGLQSGSSELYVWCDNMLDERYDLYGYHMNPMYPGGPDAQIGWPARGRTVGVGLTHYF